MDKGIRHSADVDYADLLPSWFELRVGNFYMALAGEKDRVRVLKIIRQYLKPDQRVFVGVVSPIDPHVDAAEEVRDRVLEAAEYIPLEQLGTTDGAAVTGTRRLNGRNSYGCSAWRRRLARRR